MLGNSGVSEGFSSLNDSTTIPRFHSNCSIQSREQGRLHSIFPTLFYLLLPGRGETPPTTNTHPPLPIHLIPIPQTLPTRSSPWLGTGRRRSSQGRKLAEPLPAAPGIPRSVGKTFPTKQSSGGGREACLGPQPGMAGPRDVGNGEGIPAPGAGDRDAPIPPIPQGCCNSTGSEWLEVVQIFHDFLPFLTGRISQLSRKDSQPLQERFPVSPGRISHLTWEGFPTSAGGIPHLSRKDSHSSKRNFPFLQERFPPFQEGLPIPFRNNFPPPPLRISHLSGKDFPAGPYLS